ncbi:MAG: translocation/assembly module TamB, partial [Chlorobiaceae bacterium]|nr:translocation/assembly module TamB [Chlorobiaceae bacterium]
LNFGHVAVKGAMQCGQAGVTAASLSASAGTAVLAEREINGLQLLATYGNGTLDASLDLSVPAYQEKLSASILARRNGPQTSVTIRKFTLSSPSGVWQASPDSNIDVASTYVRFNRLNFSKGAQSIVFDGMLSSSLQGTFQCDLSNFELGELKLFLLSPELEPLSGRANARLAVSGRPGAKTSSFDMRGAGVTYEEIKLGSIHLTAEHYGDRLRFDLETRNQGVAGLSSVNTIKGTGSLPLLLSYSPFSVKIPDNRPVQASLHSDDLSAKFLVYLIDLIDDADGIIPTDVRITGTMPKPDIILTARLNNTKIRVAPTQVVYYITGQVNGTPSRIDVGDLKLRDELDGTGSISGLIRLSGFKPSSVDVSATTRNLLLYNKKDLKDDTSFGTIRGTVRRFRFYGDLSAPTAEGDVNVTYSDFSLYRKGSNESAKYIGVEKFIEFVPRYPAAKSAAESKANTTEITQFKFDLLDILQINNLRLTCNVPLRYTMIFDRIRGERLEASINNLSLNVNKARQRFSLFGSVDIVGGKYVFSNNSFDLDNNGRIVWNNEEIRDGLLENVFAMKSVSASDTQSGDRDNVKLLLAIGGTINEPNVRMGYYLNDDQQPYSATNTIGRQSSHIDPNADLNVISLMLSRQWYLHPERQSRGGSLAVSSVGMSAGTGLLSSQLSGAVQKLAGIESFNVNLGTDNNGSLKGLELYFALQVPGTGGKVRFIGTGSAPTGNTSSTASNYYGSSQKIEYRINPKVYVEAFRSYGQSNSTITTSNLQKPTENWGASISYREKFHTWGQLWNRLFGGRKKK